MTVLLLVISLTGTQAIPLSFIEDCQPVAEEIHNLAIRMEREPPRFVCTAAEERGA